MPPFRYDPSFDARGWTGSIADILRLQGQIPAEAAIRTGQIQARAAEQQGQLIGNTISSIGQTVGGAIEHATDPRRKAEDIALRRQQALEAGGRRVDALTTPYTPSGPLQPGETRTTQNPYLDEDGLYKIPELNKALAASGMGHLAPDLLKSAQSINESIREDQQREVKRTEGQTVLVGDLADATLKLVKGGMPLAQALDVVGAPVIASKRFKPEEFAQIRGQLLALPPEHQADALNNLRDAAAKVSGPKTLSDGAQEVDRYGRVIAENVKTPPPGQGDYTINGRRFKADGTPIGTVQPPQTPAKSLQMKSVLVDGKPTEASYNPADGSWQVGGSPIEAARVKPIPPASITIRNMNAQAPNLPAWALDDSRPMGPDGNKPDPTTRMTPNGLYQAAQNWIANGQYPPTGRGSDPVALAQREAVNAKVGAIAAASGMDLPALRAFFKSNAASLNQQQKTYDAVQGFIATADKNAVLLEATLKKLPDLGVPLFNKPLRAFEKDVAGNVNLSQFATYLKSVQNEYARIISQPNMSGQLTDSARHEAEVLIDPKSTVPQIVASIQALKNEGANRLVSVGEQIQRIQQRMSSGAAPVAAPKSGTIRARDPQGVLHEAAAGTVLPAGWKLEP